MEFIEQRFGEDIAKEVLSFLVGSMEHYDIFIRHYLKNGDNSVKSRCKTTLLLKDMSEPSKTQRMTNC